MYHDGNCKTLNFSMLFIANKGATSRYYYMNIRGPEPSVKMLRNPESVLDWSQRKYSHCQFEL